MEAERRENDIHIGRHAKYPEFRTSNRSFSGFKMDKAKYLSSALFP